MSEIAEAVLADGSKLQYVVTSNPPRGGMKYTYFAPDKSYVVQFFNDPKMGQDAKMRDRIAAIIGKYNPTVSEENGGAMGNTEQLAEYFADKYCWPTGIVVSPEFGIVSPAYPPKFFFDANSSLVSGLDLRGRDKKSNWFTSRNRKYLDPRELGNFMLMLKVCISLARSIRRMHAAGLAHSDLSNNNVLIDPKTGSCVVIDIDSLVVPELYPPEVAGTRGYIAPEVLATMEYPYGDPRRSLPCIETDLHSLAVLIYEFLLTRHPLNGPKHFPGMSAEEEDQRLMGSDAVFIEDPNDTSNRPDDLKVTIHDLGPYLEELFIRAFVDGLHSPKLRPTAMDWERGLLRTWDLLYPCDDPQCKAKMFVMYDADHPVCPFCGKKVSASEIVKFRLKKELRGKRGQWMQYGELVVYNNMPLFPWHVYSNIFADEKASREMQAYVVKQNGRWLLINQRIKGLRSASGDLIPPGKALLLRNNESFLLSDMPNGNLVETVMIP
ncbi:MAG: hypothetical protein K6C13_01980 [Oscillospiraceae bacterium]|nr:hypothetical protein [Oscillospiraceae bacterium]